MVVALKPEWQRPPRRPSARQRYRRPSPPSFTPPPPTPSPPHSLTPSPPHPTHRSPVVRPLQPKPLPLWLKLFVWMQQGSSVMTILLVGMVLLVYGWTVHTQQRWGKQYRLWESLQKQEQQLTAANGLLTSNIAQEVDRGDAGLVQSDPNQLIFVPPAQLRPPIEPEINLPEPAPIPARPLGY